MKTDRNHPACSLPSVVTCYAAFARVRVVLDIHQPPGRDMILYLLPATADEIIFPKAPKTRAPGSRVAVAGVCGRGALLNKAVRTMKHIFGGWWLGSVCLLFFVRFARLQDSKICKKKIRTTRTTAGADTKANDGTHPQTSRR